MCPGGADSSGVSKLFVGGLAQETSKERLHEYFTSFGGLVDASVIYDTDTGRSRRFGFVTFDSPDGARLALTAVPHRLDGKQLKVESSLGTSREDLLDPPVVARERCGSSSAVDSCDDDRDPPTSFRRSTEADAQRKSPETTQSLRTDKVFVGGLPDLTNEEFKDYFSKFGRVLEVLNMYDKRSNRPRGFGFVTFESPDAVEEVIRNYDNHSLKGKWVEVKKAQPRDQTRTDAGPTKRRDPRCARDTSAESERSAKRRREDQEDEPLGDNVPNFFPDAPWNFGIIPPLAVPHEMFPIERVHSGEYPTSSMRQEVFPTGRVQFSQYAEAAAASAIQELFPTGCAQISEYSNVVTPSIQQPFPVGQLDHYPDVASQNPLPLPTDHLNQYPHLEAMVASTIQESFPPEGGVESAASIQEVFPAESRIDYPSEQPTTTELGEIKGLVETLSEQKQCATQAPKQTAVFGSLPLLDPLSLGGQCLNGLPSGWPAGTE